MLKNIPLDVPGAGAYDHTADKPRQAHRPDLQIPNMKMYRPKRLGERAGKSGPYYLTVGLDSYDPQTAFEQSLAKKTRETDWAKQKARDDAMYKTIELGAHIALENTADERREKFKQERKEKRALAMVKCGMLKKE